MLVLMRCLIVVHQPHLRHEVVWRVPPAYIYADLISTWVTPPALRSRTMLSPTLCVNPLFPLCISSFQDTAGPLRPQTANPDYSNRSHSPKVQDHESARPPHRQHHLQNRPC